MPMPPPKASTEGKRDRQVFHEMGQIVRALEANGPQPPERLAELVGATYWERDRFERALAFVVQDGLGLPDVRRAARRRRDAAGRQPPSASSSATASSGSSRPAPATFSRRWVAGRRAGDQQDVRRALQQPGERDRHRSRAEPGGDAAQGVGLERGEAAEREVRHVGDALLGQARDQVVVVAMGDVVHVLHAGDRSRSTGPRRPGRR